MFIYITSYHFPKNSISKQTHTKEMKLLKTTDQLII